MEEGKTHAALAARLLRDAASFFQALGKSNPDMEKRMQDNHAVFLQLSDLVEKDPLGWLGEGEKAETHNVAAAKLLHDAAGFFVSLSKQNPTLAEQMVENAKVFRQVADLVKSRPEDIMADTPTPGQNAVETFDPVSFSSQPVLSGRFLYRTPQINVSLPCPGQPVPPWTLLGSDRKDLQQMKDAALARDLCTCLFCGFQSARYHEVMAPRDEPILEECVTACMFCAQGHALDRVAQMRSGLLIWLPEMGQAALNRWLPVIFSARVTSDVGTEAGRILDLLLSRQGAARNRLGTNDPQVLADKLMECATPDAFRAERNRLKDIRLLPLDRRIVKEGDLQFNQFPQILAYWSSNSGPLATPARHFDLGPIRDLANRIAAAA